MQVVAERAGCSRLSVSVVSPREQRMKAVCQDQLHNVSGDARHSCGNATTPVPAETPRVVGAAGIHKIENDCRAVTVMTKTINRAGQSNPRDLSNR